MIPTVTSIISIMPVSYVYVDTGTLPDVNPLLKFEISTVKLEVDLHSAVCRESASVGITHRTKYTDYIKFYGLNS